MKTARQMAEDLVKGIETYNRLDSIILTTRKAAYVAKGKESQRLNEVVKELEEIKLHGDYK